MYTFQRDRYQKARGGTSRVIDVMCEGCEAHVAYYQKDGPGMLKRMYVDRFIDLVPAGQELRCAACGRILGNLITWHKEKRAAYRLYAGAVRKKVVSRRTLDSDAMIER